VVADAVAEGLIARSGAKGTDATTAEPLAEWERELLEGDAEKVAVQATGGDVATDVPAGESTGAAAEAPAADAAAEAATEAPAAEAIEAPAAETPAPVGGSDASADEVAADVDQAVTEAAAVDTATAVKDAEPATDEPTA
jgi:small subunit ribosomal protein S2